MAASREKVLYFEPQPSEQTAALKTVLVRMGVRIKKDRKSTRLNSSHMSESRMPSSA